MYTEWTSNNKLILISYVIIFFTMISEGRASHRNCEHSVYILYAVEQLFAIDWNKISWSYYSPCKGDVSLDVHKGITVIIHCPSVLKEWRHRWGMYSLSVSRIWGHVTGKAAATTNTSDHKATVIPPLALFQRLGKDLDSPGPPGRIVPGLRNNHLSQGDFPDLGVILPME